MDKSDSEGGFGGEGSLAESGLILASGGFNDLGASQFLSARGQLPIGPLFRCRIVCPVKALHLEENREHDDSYNHHANHSQDQDDIVAAVGLSLGIVVARADLEA